MHEIVIIKGSDDLFSANIVSNFDENEKDSWEQNGDNVIARYLLEGPLQALAILVLDSLEHQESFGSQVEALLSKIVSDVYDKEDDEEMDKEKDSEYQLWIIERWDETHYFLFIKSEDGTREKSLIEHIGGSVLRSYSINGSLRALAILVLDSKEKQDGQGGFSDCLEELLSKIFNDAHNGTRSDKSS